jgi:hypothetical protein
MGRGIPRIIPPIGRSRTVLRTKVEATSQDGKQQPPGGIAHIAHRRGGRPLCHNDKAHISVALADYRNGATNQDGLRGSWDRYCARCVAVVARMDAAKARNEARAR